MALLRKLSVLFATGIVALSCGDATELKTDKGGKTVVCQAPFIPCKGTCVNPATDFGTCGNCNTKCAEPLVCSQSKCADVCAPGLTSCDRSCVDVETDSRHCGDCSNACKAGEVCIDGNCETPGGNCKAAPTREVCDGDDNDCDEAIDEGCECINETDRECGTDMGECHHGVQLCIDGMWGTCESIEGEPEYVAPGSEDCDGLDNNCNGIVDDPCPCRPGATQDCGTATGLCTVGIQHCKDGSWGTCEAIDDDRPYVPPADRDDCDGEDNDCDGSADEECDCENGDTQDCGTALGECHPGVQHCVEGKWERCENISNEEPHIEPEQEDCDRKDNDCDGDVDEGCTCVNGTTFDCGTALGACNPGVQRCTDGRWGNCESRDDGSPYVVPEQEECDHEDNDCDGDIDEFCDCTDGATADCGSSVGECAEGTQTCVAGRWSNCVGDTGPESETCDNADNDCDGDVDEGCTCVNGAEQECGTDLGECEVGVQRCADGKWGTCEGYTGPEPEECDGADNDCDGDADENCECENGAERGCGATLGDCEPGTQRCENGRWSACNGDTGPESETCDNHDNDCDGDTDEGCECNSGSLRDCGASVGACEVGVQHCVNGRWQSCSGGVPPDSEICDNLDNDCDGDVDESCECRTGMTRGCEAGEGVCAPGQQTCNQGVWSACMSNQGPTVELCDDIDNDCDGRTDEDFMIDAPCPTGGCPQSRFCSGDGMSASCLNNPRLYAPERCDGVDNDCNGQVDIISEGGSQRSICECATRTLGIGSAVDASLRTNLCATTQCGPDRARGVLIDAICWPVCQGPSDPDGDGWGFENGRSCIMPTNPRALTAPPCDGIPIGMAMTYCLNCSANPLPFAMCQSLPQYDIREFGRGERWLKVDYTFTAASAARVPINLWFHGGAGRKRLPLVRVSDIPGRKTALLRVEDACFTPSTDFGPSCPGAGSSCAHCGMGEVCGAIERCGEYDLRQAWLQVAAEFCEPGIGNQNGTITIHSVDLVEPNCGM